MPRGGKRIGAGRPKGQGKYKEPTQVVRLPISLITSLNGSQSPRTLPLYLSKISAGFPSPAESEIAEKLDLNDYLIKHPAATFLLRVNGDSMLNAGIHENDILVVDKSLTPVNGKIVIAVLDGQLTVKRLVKQQSGQTFLVAENPDYSPIEIREQNEIHIWGVVTHVIHSV